MKNKKRWFILVLVGVFFANLALRLINIHSIPALFSTDEIHYIAEARALAVSGKGLVEGWTPWSLTPSHGWYAELSSVVLIPAQILFANDPILAGRITNVFFGSLIPLLLAGIVYDHFQSRRAAVLTAVIASVNPWLFQLSRLSYESFFSLFLYLLGWWLLQRKHLALQFLSLLPFLLGFFQYQGHKVLLVPLVFLILAAQVYGHFREKKWNWKKEYPRALVLVSVLILTVWYMARIPSQNTAQRISMQIAAFDQAHLSREVDERRRLSVTAPFMTLFVNKPVVLIEETLHRYFQSFNPVFFFWGGGNTADSWSVTSKGKFYVLDIVLMISGAVFLWSTKKRAAALLFAAVIVISPLPAILVSGEVWAMFRTLFLAPTLILLMGMGAWGLMRQWNLKWTAVFCAAYLFLSLPFFYDYFYRYPLYSTTDVYFYDRVLASYAKRITTDKKLFVIADEIPNLFSKILYYNGLITKASAAEIAHNYSTGVFETDRLKIADICFDPTLFSPNTIIAHQIRKGFCVGAREDVAAASKPVVIANLKDSGSVYTLYGDTLCSQYELPKYSRVQKNIFAVEQLSDQEFCQSFFVQYDPQRPPAE